MLEDPIERSQLEQKERMHARMPWATFVETGGVALHF